MNFLLDYNFRKSAIPALEAAGHTLHDFRELGVRGACDEDVAKMEKPQCAQHSILRPLDDDRCAAHDV